MGTQPENTHGIQTQTQPNPYPNFGSGLGITLGYPNFGYLPGNFAFLFLWLHEKTTYSDKKNFRRQNYLEYSFSIMC